MSHVRGYGRIPDLPDQRDHLLAKEPKPRAVLPASIDLRSRNYGIDDQGQLGSCVGHGTEGAFRNLLAHEAVADFAGSRLGLYYCARVIEHDTAQDAGAQIRDGVKAAANTGVMPEALWPYVISKFAEKPPAAAYAAATRTRPSSTCASTTPTGRRSRARSRPTATSSSASRHTHRSSPTTPPGPAR